MGEQGSLLDADRGPGSLPIDTTPTIQLLPKKTPGPPAGQARPRKTFLVHPWPPARHQAAPRMPPAPKALEMSDKLIDAQAIGLTSAPRFIGMWRAGQPEYRRDCPTPT